MPIHVEQVPKVVAILPTATVRWSGEPYKKGVLFQITGSQLTIYSQNLEIPD